MGGKRDLDLGLTSGECLVSKTDVTWCFQTMWGWSRSAVWHVELSHTTKHKTMLQQKLLDSPNPVPDQQGQSTGVYNNDISAPSDAASVQPHPTVKQSCSQGVTASLKLFLLVKFPELSDIHSVWRFPYVAERIKRFEKLFQEHFSLFLVEAGSFDIYFLTRVL